MTSWERLKPEEGSETEAPVIQVHLVCSACIACVACLECLTGNVPARGVKESRDVSDVEVDHPYSH